MTLCDLQNPLRSSYSLWNVPSYIIIAQYFLWDVKEIALYWSKIGEKRLWILWMNKNIDTDIKGDKKNYNIFETQITQLIHMPQ